MPQKYVVISTTDFKALCENSKIEGIKIVGTLSTKINLNEDQKTANRFGNFFFIFTDI